MIVQWTRTSYPQVNSARFSHGAIATTGVMRMRLSFLLQTNAPIIIIIIIIITYRPRLSLLKPVGAGGALAGKDLSITFWPR